MLKRALILGAIAAAFVCGFLFASRQSSVQNQTDRESNLLLCIRRDARCSGRLAAKPGPSQRTCGNEAVIPGPPADLRA